MSEIKKMKAKMIYKFRGDTADNWELLNPILSAREPGLVIDGNGKTIALKIGDGVTAWNDLELHNINDGGSIDPATLQRKLELWQPNTEYKVGDVVVEQLQMHLQMVTNILVCRQNHISGDDMFDTATAGDYWDCYPIYALNSTCASADDNGNPIIETYATKEELTTSVGNIETVLDNIIALQNLLIGGESV